MFVSNNVQMIGTIIWKHYPDTDDKRPGGTTKTTLIYLGDRDDRRLSLNRSWKSIVTIILDSRTEVQRFMIPKFLKE